MSELEPSKPEKISKYLYPSTLFFMTIGVLYLWGYWSTFGINILEYLSLPDVLKITAYPIASAFIFGAVGVLIGQITHDPERLPPGGGRDTLLGKLLINHIRTIGTIYLFGMFALLFFAPVEAWRVLLPLAIAFPSLYFFARYEVFHPLIPNRAARAFVTVGIAMLPPFAYGHGKLQAADVMSGRDFRYVASQIEGTDVVSGAPSDKRLRFLGHAGDFVFLLDPTKDVVVITKFDTAKVLQLKHYQGPPPKPLVDFLRSLLTIAS